MATRREFFRQAAALTSGFGAGTAGVLAALAGSVERAAAITPEPGSSFRDARHIVILMQENRSFDHAFGTLRGVRGFNDPRAITLPDGNPVWFQSNARGESYAPFRLDLTHTRATWLGSLPHSWRDQADARHHGNHDGWLDAKISSHRDCAAMPLTMGYYDREDLPFYYALADAFTICDQHFCSSLTGTTPNRLFLWTGTVRENAASPPAVRNSEVDYGATAHWKTFPERLEDAGISWRVYQNELSVPTGLEGEKDAWLANFTDNPLEWFDQYHVEIYPRHREYLEEIAAHIPAEIDKLRATGGTQKEIDKKEKLLDSVKRERSRPRAALSPRERSLHRKAFTTNSGDAAYRELSKLRYRDGSETREMAVPKGDPLYRFRRDVERGKLPAVSWLVAPERFSDHPSSPWYGAWYIAEALDILTRIPDLWSRTIFILTYDENDGYFDHIPPFVAPDPKNSESGKTSRGIDTAAEYLTLELDRSRQPEQEARGGPIGLGYRVPMIVASPWSRGGYVCSQVFDHTSVVQLVERVMSPRAMKPIRETNISAWRRTVCGDLASAFRPAGQDAPALGFPARDSFFERVHRAQFARMPSGFRKLAAQDVAARAGMPRQEPGVRPSTALPYELAASGGLDAARTRFEIALEARNQRFGDAAAGAPFFVYTPGEYRGRRELRTRSYAVSAGDRVTDSWDLAGFENGIYHLRVCGPNGFLREFAGTAEDPAIEMEARDVANGDIELWASSRGDVTLHIHDHGYGAGDHALPLREGASGSLVLKLERSHHWYDFSVTADGGSRFLRRFAGRVETGHDGFSDPVMGGVKL